jgi:hypothetical protein
MEIYILPHSHNDIGYTALQADVVKKQNSNIESGLRLAKATADYPEGARFVWNVEVLWCVDNYLRAATPEKRAEFLAAVKSGQIGLDAFYCNILAGLCRPEELLNLMGYATRLSGECGVPIESAMISDVPGYTWSLVSAMAQAGVKYFLCAELLRPHGQHDEGLAEQAVLVERPRWPAPRALLVPHHRLCAGPCYRRWRGASAVHPGLHGSTGDQSLPLRHHPPALECARGQWLARREGRRCCA